MKIIPVIDLLDGQVVRAQRGERDRYQPISSALCASSDPLEVTRALLQLYPFDTLYIADLGAIQQRGNHFYSIAAIRDAYPDTDLWLDAGFSNLADCMQWKKCEITFVVGSESLGSIAELHRMHDELGDDKLVLSLDWHNETPLGTAALFENANDWTQRIIVMTLGRVGSYAGPDIGRLEKIRQLGRMTTIHAAGGVRNLHDLQTLKAKGIAGVLLASALHDKKIDKESLIALNI